MQGFRHFIIIFYVVCFTKMTSDVNILQTSITLDIFLNSRKTNFGMA